MEGGLKFKKKCHLHPDYRPLVGYFFTHEMGLAKIYQYTKFEISSFTHSKFMEGVKIKKLAPES